MKAIVYTRYGSPNVLRLEQLEQPVPKDDEVLIRVRASSINSRDWRMMRANPFIIRFAAGGLLKPRNGILGVDVAGVLEAVGGQVRQFKPGNEVFGLGKGTYAEFARARVDDIAPKPAGLSFEQSAAVPLAALTALQALRDKGRVGSGQRVLIQGASGGVGTFAVQIAKHFGAEVTAVCSTRNMELARSLGADHVIDYTREDFTRNGLRYDLILAVNGFHPIGRYLHSLEANGTYVVAGGSMLQLVQAGMAGRQAPAAGRRKVYIVSLERRTADMILIKELLESGQIRPVIDGCYPLEQTAEAFRYYETVHARGKVVITCDGAD